MITLHVSIDCLIAVKTVKRSASCQPKYDSYS